MDESVVLDLQREPKQVIVAIADDDVGQRAVLEQYFMHQGYRVISFCDGEYLLTFLQTTPEEVDLIVSDNAMEIVDGIEVLERVRGIPRYQQTPFIIRTGSPERIRSLATLYGGQVVSKDEPLRMSFAREVGRALESVGK